MLLIYQFLCQKQDKNEKLKTWNVGGKENKVETGKQN